MRVMTPPVCPGSRQAPAPTRPRTNTEGLCHPTGCAPLPRRLPGSPRRISVPESARVSCEHPLLAIGVVYPLASNVKVFRLYLNTNELAPEIHCGLPHRPRPHERIEDCLSLVR